MDRRPGKNNKSPNPSGGDIISLVKNAVNLSRIFFSANKSFMHIYNMSETYLQSIKMIH